LKGVLKMTKEEIKNIIEAKGAEYGFKMQKNIGGLTSEQTNENFVRIEVLEETNNEKTSWKDHRVWVDIKAEGSICRMGGHSDAEELLKASEEIARAAKFVEDVNKMKLYFIEQF